MQKLTLLYLTYLCLVCTFSFGHAKSNEEEETEVAVKSFSQIRFRIVNRLILVEASVNGVRGNFILDSGASDLYLNNQYFEPDYAPQTATIASGIHGNKSDIGVYIAKKFEWGGLKLKKVKAYTADLQHLEKILHEKILGLIGYPILKKYELLIDYNTRTLTVFEIDKKGNRLYQAVQKKPVHTLDFKMSRHFAVIEGKIAGEKVRLGLDTGAGVGFLDEGLLKNMGNQIEVTESSNVTGVNGTKQDVARGSIKQLDIDKLIFKDVKVAFSNFSSMKKSFNAYFDGLMGYDFFSSTPIAINYMKKKLFVF
ncbi:MAG: aspartyl protease family protein [Chitinophagales bacterium]